MNFSALARKTCEELGLRKEEAVLAACRRYPAKEDLSRREQAVRRVLRHSRIETRTRIATVTVRYSYENIVRLERVVNELLSSNRLVRFFPTSQGIVLITEDDGLPAVTRAIGPSSILRTRKGLVELSLSSPGRIEEVPGVLAYLSACLASEGINVLQAISCHTDTIFVLQEKDFVPSFQTLKRAMD